MVVLNQITCPKIIKFYVHCNIDQQGEKYNKTINEWVTKSFAATNTF